MEEHDCFLLAETSVNDNMACCRGNFRACGGKFSQRCSPAVLYPCELISSGKSPSLAHFHLASWMELRVWSPEPICQLMWHPSHQTWALCLLHSGIACQIIFIPLPPSFHPFHPHPTPFYTPPPPPKKCMDMRDWFRKPGSRIVRIVLARCQTYYIDLSFLLTWMAPDNADFEQNILSK